MIIYRIRELLAHREVRERRRLTFEDLSAATGISPQVLARMADPGQEYHTTTRNLEILARTFGVGLAELTEFWPPIEANGRPIGPPTEPLPPPSGE